MAWSKRPLPAAHERSDDRKQAAEKAIAWLTVRDHSSQQLYDKLCRWYTDETAAAVVAQMIRLDYLSDERFAQSKAQSLYRQHRSRRAILQTLTEKGVPRTLAAQTVEQLYARQQQELAERAEWEEELLFTDPETASAAALIEKNYRRKLQDGRTDLVLAALQRRGFSYRAAKAALAAAQAQQGSD